MNRLNRSGLSLSLLLIVTLWSQISPAGDEGKFYGITSYPSSLSSSCGDGAAKLYDECSNQLDILDAAVEAATESSKTVLLVVGAEWCIWCHVFDKYVKGNYKRFNYKWRYEQSVETWKMRESIRRDTKNKAKELNKYVADNFVLAHIEYENAVGGDDVIEKIGYSNDAVRFFPYIIALDKNGQYAAHMLAYDAIKGLEIRESGGREYRGFDRTLLLNELTHLRNTSAH